MNSPGDITPSSRSGKRMYVIREMIDRDFEAVVAVIELHDLDDAKAAGNDFRRYLRLDTGEKTRRMNYVATADGKVVGVSGFYVDEEAKGTYWLNWTYVSPDYQRQGIGSDLLSTVEDEIRCLGARKLYVDTSSHAIYYGAMEFYRKKGFELEGMLRDYYDDGEDKLILSKRL